MKIYTNKKTPYFMAMFWQIEKLCAFFKKNFNICPSNTTQDATA
jgi:hypothetical protein